MTFELNMEGKISLSEVISTSPRMASAEERVRVLKEAYHEQKHIKNLRFLIGYIDHQGAPQAVAFITLEQMEKQNLTVAPYLVTIKKSFDTSVALDNQMLAELEKIASQYNIKL